MRKAIVFAFMLVWPITCVALAIPAAHAANCPNGPQAGPLKHSDLPSGTSVVDCHLTGRLVRSGSLTAQIPRPGTGVTLEALHPRGATTFTVEVTKDGKIRYPKPDDAQPLAATASSPKACSDAAYVTLGTGTWVEPWQWYLGPGKRPARLTSGQTLTSLVQGTAYITGSRNDCGLGDYVSASAVYQHGTSRLAGFQTIDGSNTCGDGTPEGRDGFSVVDFGNLDGLQGSPLASACVWYMLDETGVTKFIEADVRFNTTDYYWTNSVTSSCARRFDIRAVAAHEFGHVFGLGHVDEATSANLTMSTQLRACDASPRTLGKGDVLGLRVLY